MEIKGGPNPNSISKWDYKSYVMFFKFSNFSINVQTITKKNNDTLVWVGRSENALTLFNMLKHMCWKYLIELGEEWYT